MPYKVFQPPTEWIPPDTFPTQRLKEAKEIAIDLETRDPNLKSLGPGYIRGDGEIVGISVACEGLQNISRLPMKPATTWPRTG